MKDWELSHSLEESKETWQQNALWYPGLDPRTKKEISKITGEIWIKSLYFSW